MKKSKIIVPALGLLLLSTAASVTGTVAWFTSTRSVSISHGNFAVKKADGNLTATLTAGVGTSVSGSVVSINSGASLLDYSFNPMTLQMWKQSTANNYYTLGDATDYSKADASSAWKINSTSYAGVSWKVTLQYEFGADQTAVDMFVDWDVLAATITKAAGNDNGHQTGKGYRVAFIVNGSTKMVWAPERAESGVTCVTSATTVGAYSNVNVKASDTAALNPAHAEEKQTGHSSRKDYLGQVTATTPGTTDKLDVWCVVWYEGTDADVTDEGANGARLDQVEATLGFYCAYTA